MKPHAGLLVFALALGFAARADDMIERGRYMIVTGHCNNCHTAGYAAKEGKIPD
jgi:mono/diheme cytochrome c family protein